jgi:hypothetical protein
MLRFQISLLEWDRIVSFDSVHGNVATKPIKADPDSYISRKRIQFGYELSTSSNTTLPVLGISQFIPICPDVAYSMYFYYAVTDKSAGAASASVTAASGAMSTTKANCQLYYGFSFNPLPPNFGNVTQWIGNQTTNYPYFSSINSASTFPLGDTGYQFNLLQASINASTVGSRNGTYIQMVLACAGNGTTTAPQGYFSGTGAWLSFYADNFFLTSP